MNGKPSGWRWNRARMQAIREGAGLTLLEVAERTSKHLPERISAQKVRRWEAGTHVPDVREVAAMAVALRVQLAAFFDT